MRLEYPNIALDYQPNVLCRVLRSDFEAAGNGHEDPWFPDVEIPVGHYSSVWQWIEEYLHQRYTTGRYPTIAEIYAADKVERAKTMARARKDTLVAALAAKGLTIEQYKRIPRALRASLGLDPHLLQKPRVKTDRRRKTLEPQKSSDIHDMRVREAKADERAELVRQADMLLRENRAMFAESENQDALDYLLADT